jgi:branched-chain amino acid transport system ATP-binding protein
MEAPEILVLDAVTAGYGGADVVRGITLSVRQGSIVAIMGANGAGKSTLLKAIIGLGTLTGGTIRFQGREISGLSASEITSRGLSIVPEGRRVFGPLTLEANLAVGSWPVRRDVESVNRRRASIYERFPILYERRKSKAATLSGGEAQLLSIGMALMTGPSLLLLDEPSLGLAPIMIDTVYEIIEGLRAEGTTILVVEQNAERALGIADHVCILKLGVIAIAGTGDEVSQHPELRAAYLGS